MAVEYLTKKLNIHPRLYTHAQVKDIHNGKLKMLTTYGLFYPCVINKTASIRWFLCLHSFLEMGQICITLKCKVIGKKNLHIKSFFFCAFDDPKDR